MVRYKVCSYCNGEYTGASKRSRRDNKTEICAICAEFEAIRELLIQKIQHSTEAVLQVVFLLASKRFAAVK